MLSGLRAHVATIMRACAIVAAILAFPVVLGARIMVGEVRAATGAFKARMGAAEG